MRTNLSMRERASYYMGLIIKETNRIENLYARLNRSSIYRCIDNELRMLNFLCARGKRLAQEQKIANFSFFRLRRKRANLLIAWEKAVNELGVDPIDLIPKFHCENCKDTGFIPNGSSCGCYSLACRAKVIC